MATIRPLTAEEGEALTELRRALDTETKFMLAEPGERGNELPDRSYRFVADDGGRLVGVIDVFASRWRRARGRGAIVLGVRSSHHGQGVGRGLLETAIAQARLLGMWRLELTAMSHNRVALGLYEACGFQVEGVRRSSVCVDGEFVDEYYMGLVLHRAIPVGSRASAEGAP
ncbi:GNAT family N-acetyltransferase [Actinomadura sp. NPDC023710]|uniref:GNAT family N-acetyltransferase n=1 Tax=Actinomadura sp. NPDC023710 TaxID=3158219 RepID=UPI0033E3E859